MFHQVFQDIRKHFSFLLLACFLLAISGCATTKEGDYYVRNHHNENMTKVTVKDGVVQEKEISFQQYIEETGK